MIKSYCLLLALVAFPLFGQVNITGIVVDSAGAPLSGVAVKLENSGQTAPTGADGKFSLGASTSISSFSSEIPKAEIKEGALFLEISEKSNISIAAFGQNGKLLASMQREMPVGSQSLKLPIIDNGIVFFKVNTGKHTLIVKAISMQGILRMAQLGKHEGESQGGLAKSSQTAAVLFDMITATKSGYLKSYQDIANSEMTGVTIKMLKTTSPKFSFFVTSLKAMLDLSKNAQGFGGDFRFGETGPGAGLRGADKICAAIAERSMPSSGNKGWRAFLSVTADATGKQVNAIDRIGVGPWYDRVGRVMAPAKSNLLAVRPTGGDPAIQNDLPNETGIPNHRPDLALPAVDNHHALTGSNASGTLTSSSSTCKDWTTSEGISANGKPTAGFTWPRGGGGGGSGSNWMTSYDAHGCGRGVQITETGGGDKNILTVGEGGGYGGYYCFALNP